MSTYIDPNSGRAPQPGAIVYHRHAPVQEQAQALVDVAVADEVTEQDEAVVAPKPRRRRAPKTSS